MATIAIGLCGIGVNTTNPTVNSNANLPAAGATSVVVLAGAIAGVLGAYFVLLPRAWVEAATTPDRPQVRGHAQADHLVGQRGRQADVRDDGETVWAVHSVDAVNVAAADVRADEGD